jgi:tyrosinase
MNKALILISIICYLNILSRDFKARKNINALSDEELKNLRESLQFLYELPNDDRRSYAYWAGIHGYPLDKCWHAPRDVDGWPQVHLFLCWHRAYLYYLEKQLQDRNKSVSIPYWDWRTNNDQTSQIPRAFRERVVNNKPNPLYEYRINFPNHNNNHTTIRNPGKGSVRNLPTTGTVSYILNTFNHFEDFSERIRNVHNLVHLWVGGDMADQRYAGFDFIFHAHHCHIDKIWFDWQRRHGINNVPDYYLDMVLEPFNATVGKMLDPYVLGYEYVEEEIKIEEASQ